MDEERNKIKRDNHHWEMILENITEAELDFVGLKFKKGNTVDMICHYHERYPPSHSLFPSIMRTYTSGSVAEKLNTEDSDLDTIYEIGPGVVRNKVKSKSDTVKRALYYVEMEHKGFYQIEDQDGDFLYPILLQRALYHQLKINDPEQKANVLENNLSVDSKRKPNPSICTATRDKVIALRLDQWPDEIQQRFLQRNPNLERCTEIPLLLVPKSHIESKSPEVEWRLSFSLVEKEILLNLPISWRKAYQIAKSAYRTFYNDYMRMLSLKRQPSYKESLLKSYHIKTVLMWLYEEQPDFDQNDIIGLLQLIFDRLLQAIDELNLPNYFIPKQNLLSINSLTDSTQINELRIMLKAFSMTLREPPDLSQSDDVKMRCFKLSISEGALSMLKNVPDGYRFGESRRSYLMSFFKDCMNSFLAFFNNLFHSKFHGLHYISTGYIQSINRSFYRLAMVKFGLVGLESKVFLLSKLLAEYLDRFMNLQNIPRTDEKINTKIMVDLQLDQEEMKQLKNSDITKLFNEIYSEIKEDIARYETNFDGEYIATGSGYNCLCSEAGKPMTFTEKTIRTPVEIFQTLYEIHLKQHIQRVNQMVQNQLREDEQIKSELNQRQQYQKEYREFREALSEKYEMEKKRRHDEKIQRMSQRDQRMFDVAKREKEIGPWESDKQINATQAQQKADQKQLEADLAQEKANLKERGIVQRHWEAIQQDWTPEEQSEINYQGNLKSLQLFTSWETNLNYKKEDREYYIRQRHADRQQRHADEKQRDVYPIQKDADEEQKDADKEEETNVTTSESHKKQHEVSHIQREADRIQREADYCQRRANCERRSGNEKQIIFERTNYNLNPNSLKLMIDYYFKNADRIQLEANEKQLEANKKQLEADEKRRAADEKQREADENERDANVKQQDIDEKRQETHEKQRAANEKHRGENETRYVDKLNKEHEGKMKRKRKHSDDD